VTTAVDPVDVGVRDARPPAIVIRLTNTIMRPLLRTPAGRLIKPLALLEFVGRRSGARHRIVVGWHRDGAESIVLTPAAWRANFENGHPATVFWSGRRTLVVGTLDTEPSRVATVLTALLEAGRSARAFALQIPDGHTLDATDIGRTNRAVIRFERADLTSSTT
jgi:hypothetical protein